MTVDKNLIKNLYFPPKDKRIPLPYLIGLKTGFVILQIVIWNIEAMGALPSEKIR